MDENITNSLVNSKTYCSFAIQTNHFFDNVIYKAC